MTADERADLDGLLKNPGFLRLVERARQEWTLGYPAKIKLAIQQAQADKTDVGHAVAQIDFASDAINALLTWPKARLDYLNKQVEQPFSMTRGGYDG